MEMNRTSQSACERSTCEKQIIRLIYVSNHGSICNRFANEILQVSQCNNRRDSITGVLIINDEDFIQLLEGSREAVTSCFSRILLDKRHRNVQVVCVNDASLRLFPRWSMCSVRSSRVRRVSLVAQLQAGTFDPFRASAQELQQVFQAISDQ